MPINKKPTLLALALILFIFVEFSSTQSSQTSLPSALVRELASRESRYHHYLWHNIRENWSRLSSSAQRQIRDLGWAPPRPARRFSGGSSFAITDNQSGEDFLYMHRQMIRKVNNILSRSGGSYGRRIVGWTSLPAPGDRTWPTPSAYTIPGQSSRTSTMNNWKTSSFYNSNIRSMERMFTNPSELRRMTLGEFGARIEVTVHSWLHLRFSSPSSYGYRPSTSNAFPDINERWDDPRYNWLVDTYSSHVHPAFWKLHGWVDDRIEDWRRANGLSSIRWRGTWEGGPMSRVAHLWDNKESSSLRGSGQKGEPVEVVEDTMKEVARIFASEGFETSFADPVLLDVPIGSLSKPPGKCARREQFKKAL